jgi:hypothetical protein
MQTQLKNNAADLDQATLEKALAENNTNRGHPTPKDLPTQSFLES